MVKQVAKKEKKKPFQIIFLKPKDLADKVSKTYMGKLCIQLKGDYFEPIMLCSDVSVPVSEQIYI